MKALSVQQPWAHLIGAGRKTIEVRSWPTKYRGELLIVATKAPARNELVARVGLDGVELRQGAAVCIVDLVDCRLGTAADTSAAYIDPTGLFAWVLRNPRAVRPATIRGHLGLYSVRRPRPQR